MCGYVGHHDTTSFYTRIVLVPLDDLECDTDNGGCEQICINTIGNFHCNCSEGYLINDNGFSCDGEKASFIIVHSLSIPLIILQILMNVYPVHVIPMQLVTTLMVALAVIVSMAILEMAFNVLVGTRIIIESDYCDKAIFTDIDECGLDNGGCDQDCTNTLGSFFCNCSEGYLLNENGLTCDGVQYECTNFEWINFINFCLSDVDECSSDPCHSNATCNNTLGSFMCSCISGYTGDGFQCIGKYLISV